MVQLTENTTKKEAEKVKMDTIINIEPLNNHNARHWTLSWPEDLSAEEIKERVQSAEVVIDSFRKAIVQALGTKDSKVATVGFLMTKPHLHAHILLTASRRKINTSKELIQKLESLWLETIGNKAKCTPVFNTSSWADYVTGNDNILKEKQGWIKLPIHNKRLLERKARNLRSIQRRERK